MRVRHPRRRVSSYRVEGLEGRRLLSLFVSGYSTPDPVSGLTNALVAPGTGITVTGAAFTGETAQAGTFTGFQVIAGSEPLRLDDGIVLTTGMAVSSSGPNSVPSHTHLWNTAGDADVTALLGGQATHDANALTVDFTAATGIRSVSFDFVFGSDAFPEQAGTLDDTFAAFLDGVQVSFDASGAPITLANSEFRLNNTATPVDGMTPVSVGLEYDGLTRALHTAAPLNTGLSTHTLKLVIADAADAAVDSGVFLSRLAGSNLGFPAPLTTDAVARVQFSPTSYTVQNTAVGAVVTFTRTGNPAVAAQVYYETADLTGTAGIDYNARAGLMTFDPFEMSRTRLFSVLDNSTAPPETTFKVVLSQPGAGTLIGAAGEAVVTVQNLRSRAQLAAAAATASGDDGSVVLAVQRTGNLSALGSVNYETRPTIGSGWATAGRDYTPASGTIEFGAGEAQKTITVLLPGNPAAQPEQKFDVWLFGAAGAVELGAPNRTVVTVTNSHSVVEFQSADYPFPESGGLPIHLTRTGNLSSTVGVHYVVSAGTATPGTDFIAAEGWVEFGPGEPLRMFVVNGLPDFVIEPTETVSLALTEARDGAVLGGRVTATLSLTDSTVPPLTLVSTSVYSSFTAPTKPETLALVFDREVIGVPMPPRIALFARSAERAGGVARLKPFPLRTIDPIYQYKGMAVRAARPFKSNAFYQLVIDAGTIHAYNGLPYLTPFVVRFGRGAKFRYVDHDGDVVKLQLRGGGTMQLTRRADGEGDALTISGATPLTTLSGTVTRTRAGGDGRTSLASIAGLAGVIDALPRDKFDVGSLL